MRSNLQPRQLLVLMDFTSESLSDKPGGSTVVQDCILVLEYLDADSTIVRRNLDFLCTHSTNKHDYHFVLQVWVNLFLTEKLNRKFDAIDVWSDGGPHHFKTRFCQFMWHALSELRFGHKRITHHFFASYHGHSLADGHAAVIKRALKSRYQITELERATHRSSATWGPASVEEVAAILRANCANTEVTVFTTIERDEERKPTVRGVPSIKAMHCLEYSKGECKAFERTGAPAEKEGEGANFSFQ